ncbi:MAG: CDP-alcohol phosphatidyltransferase [Chloroflexi bacterium]|nr:CDP-alcohol phosphatidyltransferase [Chloroflexota bacterium]
MLSSLKLTVRKQALVVGRFIGATGISPNALTLLGLLLNFVAAFIVVEGHAFVGGIAFLIASAFDMLDGAVARAMGTTSRFGAFLDSVVDRYAEAAMFAALLVASAAQPALVFGCTLALVGSLLVSYARARAEGLGVDCEVGWLQRPERVVILAVGLIAVPFVPVLLTPIIWFLAVMTNLTVVQRVLHVRRLLSDASESSEIR